MMVGCVYSVQLDSVPGILFGNMVHVAFRRRIDYAEYFCAVKLLFSVFLVWNNNVEFR